MLVIMTTNITTDKILRDMSWLLCFYMVGLDYKLNNCLSELYSCFSYFLMGGFKLSHIVSAFSLLSFTSVQNAHGLSFKPPLEMRNRINL